MRGIGLIGCIKIILLFPFIILVRMIAKHDPHLFRYWVVHSMDFWRGSRKPWKAYAIALSGRAVVFSTCVALSARYGSCLLLLCDQPSRQLQEQTKDSP